MWLEKSLYLIKDNTKWLIKKSEKIEGNIYNFINLKFILKSCCIFFTISEVLLTERNLHHL